MAFVAQFASLCVECDEPIDAGDLIRSCKEGYRHVVCPEDVPEKPTRFQGTTLAEMGFDD